MEVEEPSRPSRSFFLAMGAVMIAVGVLVAAELAVPLQPGLAPQVVPSEGVIMAPGTATGHLNFLPANITVILGRNNTVTFSNRDTSPHTVTARDHSFDSGNLAPGGNWTYTFQVAGVFQYYCQYHNWMVGYVIVKSS